MTTLFAPNVSGMVSGLLRADATINGLFGDRIYTVLPKKEEQVFPMARVTRVAGAAPYPEAALDEAIIQIDIWDDRMATAHTAMEEIRRVLWDSRGQTFGNTLISSVRFGYASDQLDEGREPAQPRVVMEVTLRTRPV